MVSSTTPRLAPKCPSLVATISMINFLSSAASSPSFSSGSFLRSSGEFILCKILLAINAKVHFVIVFLRMQLMFDASYFMQKALQEARIAFDKGEIPVGVVLVIKNQIIARCHNLAE